MTGPEVAAEAAVEPERLVLVRGESGVEIVHRLPLPWGLASRVEAGDAQVLGSCDEDGRLLPEPEKADEPEPEVTDEKVEGKPAKKAATRKPASSDAGE